MKLENKLLFICILTLISCGGGDDGGGGTPPIDPPQAASLIFPDNNTECNEGTVVSMTNSVVTFRWTASQNTDSYEVNLRNLDANTTTKSTANTNEADINILRGTPYEWFVISKVQGTSETASSPAFKFYNAGPGVENYAPFPAEAVNPTRGATVQNSGNLALRWTGSDVDNDIVAYEVLFGTDTVPATSLGTTAETTIEVTIASGEIYYWRVISRDSQDNTSQSEIFEFSVQ